MSTHLTGKAAANDKDAAEVSEEFRVIDPELIQLLKSYLTRNDITQAEMGRRMKINGSYISRAFSAKFLGDPSEFVAAAKALLDAELNQRAQNNTLQDHGFLVEPMREFFDTVQGSHSIGVAWCDPGNGKTKGLEVYCKKNPRTIVVTALTSMSGWRALRNAVLDACPTKRRMASESWDHWIKRSFTGSGILLIIDNAHLLSKYARHWLAYDWHDQTGCPVALVGNEEIVKQWKADAQHKSRVGVAYEIQPKTVPNEMVRDLIKLHLPAAIGDEETRRLAVQVLKSGGRCRAVEKHALVASDLLKTGRYDSPADAFRAANTLLLSDVKLVA